MTLTKEQRSAAAKKAAATRKRNQAKSGADKLERHLGDLRRSGQHVAEDVADIAKSAGSAAKKAAESAARRAGSEPRRDTHR
jgi:hypothetical protein